MKEKRIIVLQNAAQLLDKNGLNWGDIEPEIEILAGDGSQRIFYRLRFENGMKAVAISPSADSLQGMEEAFSSWNIGRHLFDKGVPVPEYYAFDSNTGLILSEDLGNKRLYEFAHERGVLNEEVHDVYTRVVEKLVRMQVKGREAFRTSWCFQTSCYDRQLMLERESGYFMDALCRKLLNIENVPSHLQAEFEDIAGKAAQAPAHYFLHRDFQSRNIMIKDGRVRFIDFQGGRFGPLGYDLASLLIDPYIGIPGDMQEKLLSAYVQVLQSLLDYDSDQFRREYCYLALQRNLQILGAFAFLSGQKGKMFFQPFIRPALYSMKGLLGSPECESYKSLDDLVDICMEKIKKKFPGPEGYALHPPI